VRHLLTLGGLQALAYLVLVINIRAVARLRWAAVAVTEVIYALMNFLLIHRIVEAHTWPEALAYAAGCTVGTLAAMWATKHWRD
jgi:hypothetical protein